MIINPDPTGNELSWLPTGYSLKNRTEKNWNISASMKAKEICCTTFQSSIYWLWNVVYQILVAFIHFKKFQSLWTWTVVTFFALNFTRKVQFLSFYECDKNFIYYVSKPWLSALRNGIYISCSFHTTEDINTFVRVINSKQCDQLYLISVLVLFLFSGMHFWHIKPTINELGQKRPKKGQWRPKKGLKGQ